MTMSDYKFIAVDRNGDAWAAYAMPKWDFDREDNWSLGYGFVILGLPEEFSPGTLWSRAEPGSYPGCLNNTVCVSGEHWRCIEEN